VALRRRRYQDLLRADSHDHRWPIAAGKNTVADLVATRCIETGRTVVVADVDDVALMVRPRERQTTSLWLAAHRAHGALVAQWMRSKVDVVIALGPIFDEDEQEALYGQLRAGERPFRVFIDAPLATTWQRATDETSRGGSRQRDFHERAHARYRSLMPNIPADLIFDSSKSSAAEIAEAISRAVGIAVVQLSP
jgi:shikimate kinase